MSGEFLSRWSRLKRLRDDTAPVPEASKPATEAVPEDSDAEPRGPEAEAARSLDESTVEAVDATVAPLPSLDDLTATSHLGPFLRAGVPVVLRNAALRRMWSLDPSIRDFVSEAREYAYDWNCPGAIPGLGPLLPCDDVEAMVGRIFQRAPSEPPADTGGLHESEPGELQGPHSHTLGRQRDEPSLPCRERDETFPNGESSPCSSPDSGEGTLTDRSEPSREADETSLTLTRPTDAADAPPNTRSETAAERGQAEIAEAALGRPVRRHGGATPC